MLIDATGAVDEATAPTIHGQPRGSLLGFVLDLLKSLPL
jgi:hypothetical protein